MESGVIKCWEGDDESQNYSVPSVDEFYDRLHELMEIVSDGPCKTFCYMRLQTLESRFKLHALLNQELEIEQQKVRIVVAFTNFIQPLIDCFPQDVPHRDFYNIRKIDK